MSGPRTFGTASILSLVFAAIGWVPIAHAQSLDCSGQDPDAAAAELAAGTVLMDRAIAEARGGGEGARALAAQALAHFDRQCELGDPGALAERGSALMLLGDALGSAQSYDAFLRARPLEALDERTRRRVESNLQPGRAAIEIDRGEARLYVDRRDFGPLPRRGDVRLPLGEHVFEARDANGEVLATATATLGDGETVRVALELRELGPAPEPPPDLAGWYGATAGVAAGSLALAIGFFAASGERQSAYDSICTLGLPAEGCEAVLRERDAALGVSVASFVLAGAAVLGLAGVIIIDLSQPRSATRVSVRPEAGGALLAISHRF